MVESAHGLQRFASPITDLFSSNDRVTSWQLSPEQVSEFAARGFLGGIRVLDSEQLGVLDAATERLMRRVREGELHDRLYEVEADWQRRPHEVVFHCLGGWLVDETLHDLVFHRALTVPSAQCLGVDRLRLWHDQVFAKPPHHPGVVPWHQDYSYWTRTAPVCHITVHVALDDCDEDNGCIHYVPGSHEWGLWDMVSFGGSMDSFVAGLSPELRARFAPEPVRLRRGEAVFHHSHIVHGSYQNRSDRPRRALVVNYIGSGVRVAEPGPLLNGVPEIAVGEEVVGDFFPTVLEPTALDA